MQISVYTKINEFCLIIKHLIICATSLDLQYKLQSKLYIISIRIYSTYKYTKFRPMVINKIFIHMTIEATLYLKNNNFVIGHNLSNITLHNNSKVRQLEPLSRFFVRNV